MGWDYNMWIFQHVRCVQQICVYGAHVSLHSSDRKKKDVLQESLHIRRLNYSMLRSSHSNHLSIQASDPRQASFFGDGALHKGRTEILRQRIPQPLTSSSPRHPCQRSLVSLVSLSSKEPHLLVTNQSLAALSDRSPPNQGHKCGDVLPSSSVSDASFCWNRPSHWGSDIIEWHWMALWHSFATARGMPFTPDYGRYCADMSSFSTSADWAPPIARHLRKGMREGLLCARWVPIGSKTVMNFNDNGFFTPGAERKGSEATAQTKQWR